MRGGKKTQTIDMAQAPLVNSKKKWKYTPFPRGEALASARERIQSADHPADLWVLLRLVTVKFHT